MSTQTPTHLDALLQGIPDHAEIKAKSQEGQDLVGLLTLLGVEIGPLGKLSLVLKVIHLLESIEDMEISDVALGGEPIELGADDHLALGWNGNPLDPALTIDGTLIEDGKGYSLWARRRLLANHAAVNGQTIDGGLRLRGELEAEEGLLRLTFEFRATEHTPEVELVGELPVMDVLKKLHA
jgi:hypothetical protein